MKSLLILAVVIIIALPWLLFGQHSLTLLEKKIEQDYNVPNISADSLYQRLFVEKNSNFILIDTRNSEEYQTSHLPNALWLKPDANPETFWQTVGEVAKHKTVIFYCSVGVRSSKVAERLLKSSYADSLAGIYNLRGGIFRWYNNGYPVYNASGPTDKVHPYNAFWGRLLKKLPDTK
jgi:rhodanese-related sulfurtransferase